MTKSILGLVLLASSAAQASEVTCTAKYFNRDEMDVKLEFNVKAEDRISSLELTLNSEMARKARVLYGKEYDGRKYKNMMRFAMEGGNVENGWGWGDMIMVLLLPQGFSEMEAGDRFTGIITESASDGGSYNRVFCRVAK